MKFVQDQDVDNRILELRKGLGDVPAEHGRGGAGDGGVTSTRCRPSSHA
jgi:hypothetical protein